MALGVKSFQEAGRPPRTRRIASPWRSGNGHFSDRAAHGVWPTVAHGARGGCDRWKWQMAGGSSRRRPRTGPEHPEVALDLIAAIRPAMGIASFLVEHGFDLRQDHAD
jgi:hypothetical protein